MSTPLAERMRPKTLSEYIGQQHLVGEKAILRQLIQANQLSSFILWGPPGVGKTTLARIISTELERPFYTLSAVNSGVKEVRETIDKAAKARFFHTKNPILFIDEIHRFNKSQQDSLLAAVEDGTITLIGATTENPSFEVIPPLLSRCQIYVLKSLDQDELLFLLNEALLKDVELSKKQIELKESDALLMLSGGDARKLFNMLEIVVNAHPHDSFEITNDVVLACVQQNKLPYDKKGEFHYDVISAFIKSVRGSDPQAAVYWLARMIEGGEEARFIARRMIILAAEDIGLANPNALLLANTCFDAVHKIGWPESRIILSQTAIYLAASPKSNSAYLAINEAQQEVNRSGNLPVPLSLRNTPTKLMKDLGYGDGYRYAHDFPGSFAPMEFMPDALHGKNFYTPKENAREKELDAYLKKCWGKA